MDQQHPIFFRTRVSSWLFDLQLGLAVCAARPLCWPSNDLWKSSFNVVFLGSIFATFLLVFSFAFFLYVFCMFESLFICSLFFFFCRNTGVPSVSILVSILFILFLLFSFFLFSCSFCCNIGVPQSWYPSIFLMLFSSLLISPHARLSNPPVSSSSPSLFRPLLSHFFKKKLSKMPEFVVCMHVHSCSVLSLLFM